MNPTLTAIRKVQGLLNQQMDETETVEWAEQVASYLATGSPRADGWTDEDVATIHFVSNAMFCKDCNAWSQVLDTNTSRGFVGYIYEFKLDCEHWTVDASHDVWVED